MGGEWTTVDAWRASKEYEPWANVDKKKSIREYNRIYQLWRTKYLKTWRPRTESKINLTVFCECGANCKFYSRKIHYKTKKHTKWVEEQENKKPKIERKVVCKFLW